MDIQDQPNKRTPATKKVRALLLSLPWFDYRLPSISIGALSAYAKTCGVDVQARHLHLEAAIHYGVAEYKTVPFRAGSALAAALLFPNRRKSILRLLQKRLNHPEVHLNRFGKVMEWLYSQMTFDGIGLVGFTIDYAQLFPSLLFAQWLKRDYPDIKVLFGGHTTGGRLGKSIVECFPQVDWCINGEGEVAFVRLVSELSRQRGVLLGDVPGLVYRKKGRVISNPSIQLQTLEGLPDPDYEHYFQLVHEHPLLRDRPIVVRMPVEAGRGCTHNCAFCANQLHWKGYRSRSPKKVAAQIRRLSKRYSVNFFWFMDMRTQPRNDKQLFRLLAAQGRDYYIIYELRADADREQLIWMSRAGVRHVQIGIEALSTALLKKMTKGIRTIDNLHILKICEELNLRHSSILMLGFPTESQKEIDESVRNIEYARAYRPPQSCESFILLEGSSVNMQRSTYGVCHVQNDSFYQALLPSGLRKKMTFFHKHFQTKKALRQYSDLKKAHEAWKRDYEAARKREEKLLAYWDCKDFLRIDDYRDGITSIVLKGDCRNIYLYCNVIQRWADIKDRFNHLAEDEIRIILDQFVALKVMFQEENCYLSLAVRAGRYVEVNERGVC